MIADLNSQLSHTEQQLIIQQKQYQQELQLLYNRIQKSESSPRKEDQKETIISRQVITQHLNNIQSIKESTSPASRTAR